jgi:hypothetical protein
MPPKRRYISATLQDITYQEVSNLKNPAMRTTNHITCSSQQAQPALVNLPVNEVHSLKPSAQFHFMSPKWLNFSQLYLVMNYFITRLVKSTSCHPSLHILQTLVPNQTSKL